MPRRATKSRITSPERAGRSELTPTPARYAPHVVRHRTRSSGYAAARTFRHARARTAVFTTWRSTASARAPQPIDVSPSQKDSKASCRSLTR